MPASGRESRSKISGIDFADWITMDCAFDVTVTSRYTFLSAGRRPAAIAAAGAAFGRTMKRQRFLSGSDCQPRASAGWGSPCSSKRTSVSETSGSASGLANIEMIWTRKVQIISMFANPEALPLVSEHRNDLDSQGAAIVRPRGGAHARSDATIESKTKISETPHTFLSGGCE